uniref:Uncharacterized protein n=1 Tax=Romanomermis culicivorax TaxID=13658 RepID=A0A915HTV8_ROMCU
MGAPLNDFTFHSVSVQKTDDTTYFLTVDGRPWTLNNRRTNPNLVIDDTDVDSFLRSHRQSENRNFIFVGSVERANITRPKWIQAKQGFKGCLTNLIIGDTSVDLIGDALAYDQVQSGCDGPKEKCQIDSCANSGFCSQQWTTFYCDCSMTTYSGPKCTENSISYKFGPRPGLVIYTYTADVRPSAPDDHLAVGLLTNVSKCAIFHVDSSTSTDFLTLQLEDGYAVVRYDVGSGVNYLSDLVHRINDEKYHGIKYGQRQKNSGDYLMLIKSDIETFDKLNRIHLGGKKPVTRSIRSVRNAKKSGKRRPAAAVQEPFFGVLSGVYYNGIKVLDRAAENDPSIKVIGDARPYRPFAESKMDAAALNAKQSTVDFMRPLDGVGMLFPSPPGNRTAIIATSAVILIVLLIVAVFIVFLCRQRPTGDSYTSVDESLAKNFPGNLVAPQGQQTSNGAAAGGSRTMSGFPSASRSLLSMSKIHQQPQSGTTNGLKNGKSKKDVKEWYV